MFSATIEINAFAFAMICGVAGLLLIWFVSTAIGMERLRQKWKREDAARAARHSTHL